ncbi:MAG: ribosome biogenesis GTPase Der [Oligosphaeraceae bacterium]
MEEKNPLPVVAIVGRPNVGKSALFNAILRRRLSIVHEQSGVTRDCVASPAEFRGKRFMLVDTGGLGTWNGDKKIDLFDGMIREQVTEVLKDATCLLWVVNCLDGVTPQDEEVGAFLRKSGKPLLLCANKADNRDLSHGAPAQFSSLGVQEIFPTTCTHSHGIEALLRHLTEILPDAPPSEEEEKPLRVAVVGRPNVGKSSLVNRLLGENRMMVSDVAGTTRDAVDLPVVLKKDGEEMPITLVDTAGLRRKGQISTVVEFFSANRTELAIRSSDMVLFVLDSQEPCTTQERRIGRIIADARRPCIMLASKWDLVTKAGNNKPKLFEDFVRNRMPYMAHAPILNISSVTGYNLNSLFDRLKMVKEQMHISVPTAVFNQFLQDILQRNPPVSVNARRFKIFYGTMVHNPPPKFVLFVNDRKLCPKNYESFLENRLRDAFFPQSGLPINLELRNRQDPVERQGARAAAAGDYAKQRRLHRTPPPGRR